MLFQLALLAIAYYAYHTFYGRRRGLPPGPMPLPLFGNLLSIDRKHPAKTICDWSAKYGPLMTVWMPKPHVFITDAGLMRETVGKQGDAYAGRLPSLVNEAMTQGYHGLTNTNGERFKEQRRFAINVMRELGFGRNVMEAKIGVEVTALVQAFEKKAGRPFDPWKTIDVCVLNIISAVSIGHRFEPDDPRFKQLAFNMVEMVRLLGSPKLQFLDNHPWLRHLPIDWGFDKMIGARRSFDDQLGGFIEERSRLFDPDAEPDNYIDAFLGEMHRRKKSGAQEGHFNDTQLKMAISDLTGAGMETTVTTMRWGILYMMLYPDVQEKVHSEIAEAVGIEHDISMQDKTRLPYTTAAVQELQRCSDIVPINIPHTTTRDVQIGDYHLRKGTLIVPQISAINQNPKLFPEPDKFDPTRFLDKNNNDNLLVFSLGKRQCLGEGLARMEVFIIFATMMQKFKFSPPNGSRLSLEPAEGFIRKPRPFECVVELREK